MDRCCYCERPFVEGQIMYVWDDYSDPAIAEAGCSECAYNADPDQSWELRRFKPTS